MRIRISLAVIGLLIAVPVAIAAQEPIGDVELEGGSNTTFETENDQPGNDDCLTADIRKEDAFTPIDDGDANGDSDAFDDGLLLLLNGKTFVDSDGEGNHVGQQLKVGPSTLAGLKVTRTDRALSNSPTLRSLITLKNSKNRAKRARIVIESDYGADDDEVVRDSAVAPKGFHTKADGWLVVADDASSPGDAIVTHGFFGKGAKEKVTKIPNNIPNADSCLDVQYSVKIPAKSKRHLMLLTQLSENDDISGAKQRAKALGKARLGQKFLVGLNKKTQAKILNWDLG